MNNRNGETFFNEKLQQAVSGVREETDVEHEHKINEITCDTSFHSPMLKKNVSTIKNSVYYGSDDQVDTISDSNRQVDPRSDPKAETHIFDRVRKLSIRQVFKPFVIRVI